MKTNKIILTCFIILFAGCKKNNVSATKKIETIDSVQEKNLVNKDEDIENNNNKSFVISCGSGCAMTYNVKAIEDLEKFKKVKVIMSESYENDRQIPEATWSFEYNWKFYLTIYNCNPLTEEINERLGVYKWMILNPQKYFEMQNELEKVSDKVWDILENEE